MKCSVMISNILVTIKIVTVHLCERRNRIGGQLGYSIESSMNMITLSEMGQVIQKPTVNLLLKVLKNELHKRQFRVLICFSADMGFEPRTHRKRRPQACSHTRSVNYSVLVEDDAVKNVDLDTAC